MLPMKLLPFCGYGQRNYEASAWDLGGVKKRREERKHALTTNAPFLTLILLAVRGGRAHSSSLGQIRDYKHSFIPVRRPCF
jgi:hypothetical protein